MQEDAAGGGEVSRSDYTSVCLGNPMDCYKVAFESEAIIKYAVPQFLAKPGGAGIKSGTEAVVYQRFFGFPTSAGCCYG